jgi:hypothetical protein
MNENKIEGKSQNNMTAAVKVSRADVSTVRILMQFRQLADFCVTVMRIF